MTKLKAGITKYSTKVTNYDEWRCNNRLHSEISVKGLCHVLLRRRHFLSDARGDVQVLRRPSLWHQLWIGANRFGKQIPLLSASTIAIVNILSLVEGEERGGERNRTCVT